MAEKKFIPFTIVPAKRQPVAPVIPMQQGY